MADPNNDLDLELEHLTLADEGDETVAEALSTGDASEEPEGPAPQHTDNGSIEVTAAQIATSISLLIDHSICQSDSDLLAIRNAEYGMQQPVMTRQDRDFYKQAWDLWKLCESQMYDDIIVPLAGDDSANTNVLRQWNTWPVPVWDLMNMQEKASTLLTAARAWHQTFAHVMNMTVITDESLGNSFIQRVNHALVHLSPRDASSVSINSVLDFFASFSAGVSDLAYLLDYESSGQTLDTLESLPSRHSVLKTIASEAPNAAELAVSIEKLLMDLPQDKHSCNICLAHWSPVSDTIAELAAALHEAENDVDASWLSIKASGEGMEIKVHDDFRGVSLKMSCGHIFCAGCIKTWLDISDGPLQCPFRDQEYGLKRATTVMKIEEIVRDYRSSHDG